MRAVAKIDWLWTYCVSQSASASDADKFGGLSSTALVVISL